MHSLTLYRIDPGRNMSRFYHLDIQPDLFGNECVVREWERIGRAGQTRIVPYPTITEAQSSCEKQRTAKGKKGYVPAPVNHQDNQSKAG